jgi:hypothetical protein
MGNARFLYNNLITSETMLAVSSLRSGVVTAVLKEGVGSAILNPSGAYSGATDKEYIVEIDALGTGEVGSSTFRWSDGSGAWNEDGVTTSATNYPLSSGILINFSSGSGADFAVGDRWYFKGINLFHAGKMIDVDRDHRYRSSALGSPNTITITLGSPLEVKVIVLADHNLSSGATIVLKGHTADSWASPNFTETITPWNEGNIIQFLTTAVSTVYKCWQIQITDPGNPDGYIEIGELFLGSYLELTKNYVEGYSERTDFLKDTNRTSYGVERDRFYNSQLTFSFNFGAMPPVDVASMKTLIAALGSRSLGTFKPLWFNTDSATPNDTYFVKLSSLPINNRTKSLFDMPLEFKEVVTSV